MTPGIPLKLRAFLDLSEHQILALFASACCFMTLVEGAVQQLQMSVLGGRIYFGNSVVKIALLAVALLGCFVRPRIKTIGVPLAAWLLCISYLIFEVGYLTFACGMSLGDILLTYYDYYFLLMIGPALIIFRGVVSEKVLIQCTVFLFAICAAIGFAQHLTSSPILYTESLDGSFQVRSWDFMGEVRAFSLFGSGLGYGFFCAFCGALGVALSRKKPIAGSLLCITSGLACYTTLTRLSYLTFLCACSYSLVLTFGKKPSRGRWQPLLYLVLGIATIVVGAGQFTSGEGNGLQDASSLLERINSLSYYWDFLRHSTFSYQMFGFGITQVENIHPAYPMIIDNTPLALFLHTGFVGLVLFGVLLTKMWIYLRREALAVQQPFIIAVTSLWAVFACAGIFNIVLAPFGTLFCLAILCGRTRELQEKSQLSLESNSI